MRVLLSLVFIFCVIISSCSRGGHPCPTLSTSPGEKDQALVKRSVPTTKGGLVKKKGVKKVKRR